MEYNGNPLFNEPVVNQYGSHMVMTGGSVPPKKKYYSIDTRFRDDYDSVLNSSIVITLPQRISKVKSLKVTNAEIPFSYYNVSSALNNNTILFTDNLGTETVYTIADGFYSASSTNTIASYFGSHPILQDLSGNSIITYSSYNTNSSRFVFTPSGSITSMTMQFAVSTTGQYDKLELKNKIGWMLGFRLASYTFTAANTTIVSEAFLDMNGFKYMFLVLDEFTQTTNDNTFVSPLYRSIINKNIICRINTSLFPLPSYKFADTIFVPNEKNGTLVSDKRTYNSVDLQKLRVELVNEFGNSIHLNGLDFSFCLEIEYY